MIQALNYTEIISRFKKTKPGDILEIKTSIDFIYTNNKKSKAVLHFLGVNTTEVRKSIARHSFFTGISENKNIYRVHLKKVRPYQNKEFLYVQLYKIAI